MVPLHFANTRGFPRQHGYSQVKQEPWGTISIVKADKDYLIRTVVVIEEDYLSILGLVSECVTPDLVMLKWITVIKSMNSEIRHISRKENAMADILSRARFEEEDNMVSKDEDVKVGLIVGERAKHSDPTRVQQRGL